MFPSQKRFLANWDKLPPADRRAVVAAMWDMFRVRGNSDDFEYLRQIEEFCARRAETVDTPKDRL